MIYRGYDIRLEDGRHVVYKDGNHVYTLPTTTTEEAAMNWVDAEKRRQREAGR